jgi:hypothetical protein
VPVQRRFENTGLKCCCFTAGEFDGGPVTVVFFGVVAMAGNRSHHLAQRGLQILSAINLAVLSIRSTPVPTNSPVLVVSVDLIGTCR